MSVDVVLWGVVALLTVAAGWLSLPRPPELDWERFFKTTLVTLLRGPLEAQDATAVEWLAASRERVWFHPGARDLLAKLTAPEDYEIPVPAMTGELALVEELRRIEGVQARLGRTFLDEPRADETLFDDPLELGLAYDTVPVLGPGADWEAVSRWDPVVVEGLRRRLAHTRVAVVGGEGLALALAAELGEGRAQALAGGAPDDLAQAVALLLPESSDRLVWIGVGEGAAQIVRALHASPGLRDRTRAVVALAAALDGDVEAWLADAFDHGAMDTELSRTTPYFQLAWVVPGVAPLGEPGRPLAGTRWPEMAAPDNGRVAIETVDLGVLPGPGSALDTTVLARALVLTLVQRLALVG